PDWFSIIDSKQDMLSVVIDARPASDTNETLEIELSALGGVEGDDTQFEHLYRVRTAGARGLQVPVPVSTLRSLPRSTLDAERDKFSVTLRLRVRQAGKVLAEARRTIFLVPEQTSPHYIKQHIVPL